MAAVLTIVVVLQYRWTKQLSEASEARLATTLQPLMIGWHLDFYGELSAVCVALQVGPDSGARDTWDDYLNRYVNWSHAPVNPESVENIYANPGLVKEIYVWQTTATPAPRLFRLNRDASRIEPSAAPSDLEPLLARLRAKSSSLTLGLRAWELASTPAEERLRNQEASSPPGSQRSSLTTGWQFDQNIPAIVHPIVSNGHHSDRASARPTSSQDPVNWIVVVLDSAYIRNKVIPDLINRNFSSRNGLEYRLALIRESAKPQVIYSSDNDFPASQAGLADSRMNIFGPPPESVEGDFWQAIKNSESIRNENWRNFSAPVWFPVFQYTAHEEPWVLLAQHRSGPLDAIARSIWHRNLLTSGIVLLLLTCCMSLIVFATRRAQKLAQLRLDFVANISHELLTPIAAIHSVGQNLRDGLCDTKADSILTGTKIAGQARQLADMVRQILLFASAQNGTLRYTLSPLTISDILENVRKNVATVVEGNGFEVEQSVQEGIPAVLGDLPALSQCLQNLIVNAVKYSGTSHRIGISASLHDASASEREVRISVQDHGRGISHADLAHIFEPFFRSPAVVDAQIHGTGLGLAVARQIAQAMGGRLSVMSVVDVGSTFTLHLPALSSANGEANELISDSISVGKHE